MSKAQPTRRVIGCYMCGHRFEVSARTMSVPCPRCHKALKVEDVVIKSYTPVNDVQTCGAIHIQKNGRVAARIVRCGEGIECDGTVEASIETEGPVVLASRANWKGTELKCRSLAVEDGAKLNGRVRVPWVREGVTSDVSEAPLGGPIVDVEIKPDRDKESAPLADDVTIDSTSQPSMEGESALPDAPKAGPKPPVLTSSTRNRPRTYAKPEAAAPTEPKPATATPTAKPASPKAGANAEEPPAEPKAEKPKMLTSSTRRPRPKS